MIVASVSTRTHKHIPSTLNIQQHFKHLDRPSQPIAQCT